MRLGTTNVPRTLHAVANTMKVPITAATTLMAMPQLGMANTPRRGESWSEIEEARKDRRS